MKQGGICESIKSTRGPSVNPDNSPAWYALSVRSHAEQIVCNTLKLKGVESYLPITREIRRWSDRVKEIQTPLFPGYVFARFDCRDRLPVLRTPAVVDIVGFGQQYVPVSELELNNIRRILESRARCQSVPFLQVGQQVVIAGGPLAGIEGLLIEIKESRQLVVSISILQRSVQVELKPEWVAGMPSWQPMTQRGYGRTLEHHF